MSDVADESVDVVTTRSVLIYVQDKPRAFEEFYRDLRPGGRVSLFEPINKFARDNRLPTEFWGYDAPEIAVVVAKVTAAYDAVGQPPSENRDVELRREGSPGPARGAGFPFVRLHYEAAIEAGPPIGGPVQMGNVLPLLREPAGTRTSRLWRRS